MSRILSDLASEMDCTSRWATPSFAMAEELGNITPIDGPSSFPSQKGLCRTMIHLLESALGELVSTTQHLTRTNYLRALEQAMRDVGAIPRGVPAAQGEERIRAFIALVRKMEACASYQTGNFTGDDIFPALMLQKTLFRLHELSKDAGHTRTMRRPNPNIDLHE